MDKRLYRSSTNKVFGGVCGGLGDYFEVDPVLIRIITVLMVLATGFGLLAYIIAWIIIPKRQASDVVETPPQEYKLSSWNRYLPGVILIGVGLILLVHDNWYWFDWDQMWPVIFIAVGLVLIFRRGQVSEKTDEVPLGNESRSNGINHNGGPAS